MFLKDGLIVVYCGMYTGTTGSDWKLQKVTSKEN